MNERIVKALAVLEAEGLSVKLEPGAVIVKVGKLAIDAPNSIPEGTVVTLDGVKISDRMTSVDLRIAVGEVTRATIGVIP